MQSLHKTFPAWTTCCVAVAGAAALLSSQGPVKAAPLPLAVPVVKTVGAAQAVAALRPVGKPMITLSPEDRVRSRLKFETVRWGGKPVTTLDEASRLLLARAAAEKARLGEVGLSYHDVYGVIEAETSWIPRTGSSKDGTPNLGLAQFEPRTAKGLGVRDPSDPVQAVFGAAMYMKHGAKWAHGKIGHLKLSPEQRAAKVREGVSVYYNLSVKGRNRWDGMNARQLPEETQKHIRNAMAGAMEAAQLARQLSS
jgi:hypothetical protein